MATIPWSLLARLGVGTATTAEVEAVTPLLLREAVEPPNWFISRAALLSHQEERTTRRQPSLLDRLKATLVFDSGLQLQLAGVRGRGGRSRRLVYAAGPLTAHVEVREERGGAAVVAGQLVSSGRPRRFAVELCQDGAAEPCTTTESNDFGYFAMIGVQPATYTLLVHDEEGAIDIHPLVV